MTNIPANPDPKVRILGVNFHTGSLEAAVTQLLAGGLLVAPSGPGMSMDLVHSDAYRRALTTAEIAITDSGWMVLLWLLRTGQRLPRNSGLKMIEALTRTEALRPAGTIFWVMPSPTESERNRRWLNAHGIEAPESATYLAPMYGAGDIADPALLALIEAQRPRLVILCVGGGVQERLGLMLRDKLNYKPGIACLGAAIAFFTGGQAKIPSWADKLFLGWAFRIAQDPKRFWRRYWEALRLAPLIMRYRDRLPSLR